MTPTPDQCLTVQQEQRPIISLTRNTFTDKSGRLLGRSVNHTVHHIVVRVEEVKYILIFRIIIIMC